MSDSALGRTLLLASHVLGPSVDECRIEDGLRATQVAVIYDEDTVAGLAGQSGLVMLVQLLLAMGASVRLSGPDAVLVRPQPPLATAGLLLGLEGLAKDAIPDVNLTTSADVAGIEGPTLVLGRSHGPSKRRDCWRLAASDFRGWLIDPSHRSVGYTGGLPFGPGVAAVLGAAEVFKFSLRRLAVSEGVEDARVHDLLAPSSSATLGFPEVPVDTQMDLGVLDVVSAGAITNSMLHALLRIDGLRGVMRIMDEERLELSNLNRYALALRSQCGELKVDILSAFASGSLTIDGLPKHFTANTAGGIVPLAGGVVVGADHIPTRWLVQTQNPQWLGVGASSGFMSMSSEHFGTYPCVGCLHPEDDGVEAPIATVSFVSYLAGLSLAARLVAHRSDAGPPKAEASLLWPMRMDTPAGSLVYPVQANARCPLNCSSTR